MTLREWLNRRNAYARHTSGLVGYVVDAEPTDSDFADLFGLSDYEPTSFGPNRSTVRMDRKPSDS